MLDDLHEPPIESVGALTVDAFSPKAERSKLASALNNLLASPTFAPWRTGETLDVGSGLTPKNGKPPGVILSVAHLDEAERNLVLGVILEEVLAWTRSMSGTSRLRALVVFDEVYGYLPPYPNNPPTKRPPVAEDRLGNTPLMTATHWSRGRGEIITALLEAGADAHRENESGVSPLKLAETIANYPVRQWFPVD